MKKLPILLVMLLAFAGMANAQTFPTTFWADSADTTWYNAAQDEFSISTAEELAGVAQLVLAGNTFINKTFTITENINLDGNLWTPIGKNNNFQFSGTVQGDNHIISNLWINLPAADFVGLFGFTSTSTFSNIRIETANIKGFDNTASLVANLFDNGSVTNCSAINVTVEGNNSTGGLVGGFLTNSSITASYSIGDVTGSTQVGGLAGTGWNKIDVVACYSEGTVTGDFLAGGLIGGFPFSFGAQSTINNSYSRSMVVAITDRAGGITGGADNALLVKNSYATGNAASPGDAGAIIGLWGNIAMQNMYYDSESSGMTQGVGGFSGAPTVTNITEKTTTEMKSTDMVALLNAGSNENPWTIDPNMNDGYPIIAAILGIADNNLNTATVTIYPTVFDTNFTVSSTSILNSYKIYNLAGALVLEGILNKNVAEISAGQLATGMYILRIRSAEGMISKKIIKN